MMLDPALRTELMDLASRAGRPLREIVVTEESVPIAQAQLLEGDRLVITSAVTELPMDVVRAVVALAICRRRHVARIAAKVLGGVGVSVLIGYFAATESIRTHNPVVSVIGLVLVVALVGWVMRARTGATEAAALVGGPDVLLNAAARVAFHNATVRGFSREKQRRMAYGWMRPIARELSVPRAELDSIIKHCGG